MKKIIEQNKGITLIALVTTVIILLILASIATYSGKDIIKSSKLTKFTTEMKIMQTEVNSLYDQLKNGNEEVLNYGEEISLSDNQAQKSFKGANITNTSGYRLYTEDTFKKLNIQEVDENKLVNIKERSVISYEGFKYDDKIYYTLEQLPQSLYNVEYKEEEQEPVIKEVKREKLGTDKWRITISQVNYEGNINKWQVKYKLETTSDTTENEEQNEEHWNISQDLSFIVTKQGNYEICVYNNNKQSKKTIISTDNWIIKDDKITNGIYYEESDTAQIEIPIGEYVEYNCTENIDTSNTQKNQYISSLENNGYANQIFKLNDYNGKWKIFGVENGKILLISDENIIPNSGGGENGLYTLFGKVAYKNCTTEIDKICNLYGQAKFADGGRSIKIEDINNITNYQEKEKNKYYNYTKTLSELGTSKYNLIANATKYYINSLYSNEDETTQGIRYCESSNNININGENLIENNEEKTIELSIKPIIYLKEEITLEKKADVWEISN